LIEHNKISHLGTYDAASGIDKWGMGVLLYNNQYAHVTDNCIEDVRVGIQTGNFWRANPGSADCQKIENNTIQARRRGIFHNLFYSAASPFTVSNNTITGLDNSNETLWDGMLVSSHANAVQTIQDNSVDGTGISTQSTIGINIWNDQVAPLVDGGNISNVEIGINVNNYEGYNNSNANNTLATIESVTISATTEAGIKVHDNPSNTNGATVNATIGNGNTITGSPIGVWIVGSDATATITHNDFTSNTTDIQADATAGSVVANYNNLSGSSYGINNLSANTLDGKHNYWNDGDDSGPGSVGSGTGVHVSTNVDFCPWLDDAAPVGVPVNAAAGTLLVTETGGPVDDDGEVCIGEAVTLTVDGAQPGSTYLWTGGETIPTVNLNPTSSMVYSVTVSYGGCTTVHSYNITVYPVLGVNLVDLDNVLCYGESNGSIEVTGDIGQSPYSYNWSNGVTTALNAGLSAGVYDVTVTDANQCTASASYTVTEPTLLEVVNFAVSNESCQACDDGTITVNATGGITPYQYSNDGGATWHGSNFFGGLVAGTYSMIVKDVNGCETAPQDVVITEDGVYPDLRAFRVISSSQYYMGDTSDEMIQIRNVGTGQTVAPIEFLVTKFVPAAGVDISQNMDVSVTILGDTYPLSNSSFTVVDLGYAYKFTSNSGIYIPVGGFLNVGLKYERVGGTKGQMSSSVNITNGTGGGEINYQNNISIIKMIKL